MSLPDVRSAMSWEEAVAAVTGPDGAFPLVDAEVEGRPCKVFRNAPPSLRHLFAVARGPRSGGDCPHSEGSPGDCPHSEGSPATVDGRPLIGRG